MSRILDRERSEDSRTDDDVYRTDEDEEEVPWEVMHRSPKIQPSEPSNAAATEAETPSDSTEEEAHMERMLVSALADGAYHLPEYSWCQDWVQYMTNNHPLFGICCHHKRHPVSAWTRVLGLLGSILCGLTISNLFYLWALQNQQYARPILSISLISNTTQVDSFVGANATVTAPNETVNVSALMALLWTVGGAAQAIYDNLIWSIAACQCCPSSNSNKRVKSMGFYLILLLVLVMGMIASLVVLLRVSTLNSHTHISAQYLTVELLQNQTLPVQTTSKLTLNDFRFLRGYMIELVLGWLVYYPLVGTLLFSGILGCGRLPILGGRPRDLILEEKEHAAWEKRRQRRKQRLEKQVDKEWRKQGKIPV